MKEKEIIILAVRGTNGTVNEWSSNFDVGANTSDYWDQANPLWTNKANHKGFDVTKNRLKAKVDAYVKQYVTAPASDQIYYVTGHSRGAALGNLLAKELIDSYSSSKVFSYTFATPNNTTSSSATSSKYKGLFSILNTDDIVPQMPLKDWGFTNYGQIREVSVREKYKFNATKEDWEKNSTARDSIKGTFEELTGHIYNSDSGTRRTLTEFYKVANDRNALYRKDYDRKKLLISWLIPHEYTNYRKKIDEGLRLQRHIYTKSGADIYQTPAFLMQDLAYLASKADYDKKYSPYSPLGNDVSNKYEAAKASFIRTSGSIPIVGTIFNYGGMAHPHLPQTYYLIARNNFVPITQR